MNDRDTERQAYGLVMLAVASAILGAVVFAGLVVHAAVTDDIDVVDIVIMAGACLLVLGAGLTTARKRPGRNTSIAAVYAEELTNSNR